MKGWRCAQRRVSPTQTVVLSFCLAPWVRFVGGGGSALPGVLSSPGIWARQIPRKTLLRCVRNPAERGSVHRLPPPPSAQRSRTTFALPLRWGQEPVPHPRRDGVAVAWGCCVPTEDLGAGARRGARWGRLRVEELPGDCGMEFTHDESVKKYFLPPPRVRRRGTDGKGGRFSTPSNPQSPRWCFQSRRSLICRLRATGRSYWTPLSRPS